ncbi:hypothetical protein [Xylophilus rhododendri]|nr:hypothetical protein [Xylophilus rhododendri]
MQDSDKMALAAQMHVLLRRITGRVTDTEWMVRNPEYARAMVALARQTAVTDRRPELQDCADRLEQALALAQPPAPAAPPAAAAPAPSAASSKAPAPGSIVGAAARYIGRLR